METLSLETLRALYGNNFAVAHVVQVRLTYAEWTALADQLKATPWQHLNEHADTWLISRSVLVEGGIVLVL